MKTIVTILTFVATLITSCSHEGEIEKMVEINLSKELSSVTEKQEIGDFIQANNQLERLIDTNPNEAELYFRLAHSKSLYKGNTLEIIRLLDQCLNIDSLHFKAMFLKSQGHMLIGDFKGALKIENRLIKAYPNLFQLKFDRVSTYLFNGDFNTVISESNSLMSLCSEPIEEDRLHNAIFLSYYFLKNYDLAQSEISIMESKNLNTAYSTNVLNEKIVQFSSFAVGSNVGVANCSLSQLEYLFP